MRFRTPALSLGLQLQKMGQYFPNFRYYRERNIPTWRGTLKPLEFSPEYEIKISYHFDNQFSKRPQVWVVSPILVENAPHTYPDKSLCLYYPQDGTWTPHKFISTTVIPLTALWLGFYDIWLRTGIWYGPEAPHGDKKN